MSSAPLVLALQVLLLDDFMLKLHLKKSFKLFLVVLTLELNCLSAVSGIVNKKCLTSCACVVLLFWKDGCTFWKNMGANCL